MHRITSEGVRWPFSRSYSLCHSGSLRRSTGPAEQVISKLLQPAKHQHEILVHRLLKLKSRDNINQGDHTSADGIPRPGFQPMKKAGERRNLSPAFTFESWKSKGFTSLDLPSFSVFAIHKFVDLGHIRALAHLELVLELLLVHDRPDFPWQNLGQKGTERQLSFLFSNLFTFARCNTCMSRSLSGSNWFSTD